MLLGLPPEILLYLREHADLTSMPVQSVETHTKLLVSFLDLPDLSSLARVYPELAPLVDDPVLNHERLWVVGPSRVCHSLFGTSTEGLPLRPSIPELVHRNIMRGLGIERRWRDGMYFGSSTVRPML